MNLKLSGLLVLLTIFLSFGCKKETVESNAVPVSNAGNSKSITLPTDSVTAIGSGTDADGHVVAYLWSKVSGPLSYTIVNPGSATTVIRNLTQGTYVFQLMVTDDDGATGVDSMSIQVGQAPIQTITLQPSNNTNELELINKNGVDESSTGSPDIPIEAWTFNSTPLFIRELIKFDLSSIPSNATIQNATLTLYSYPDPPLNGNLANANFGTNNTMLVQQVSSNWSSASTNWFNQPASTTANQVIVPTTTQSNLDLNLNVTAMIASMVNGNANYGFMLKLQNEVTYNSRIFVSSYNTSYSTRHPKLVITYQP